MVVVKAGAVAEDEVAADGVRGKAAAGILGEVVGFVVVLEEFLNAESARIAVRVFALIVPAAADARGGSGVDERDGFGHHILAFRAFPADADLGFGAELDIKSSLHGQNDFLPAHVTL